MLRPAIYILSFLVILLCMVICGYQQQTDQSPHYDIEEIEKIRKLLMDTPSCWKPANTTPTCPECGHVIAEKPAESS